MVLGVTVLKQITKKLNSLMESKLTRSITVAVELSYRMFRNLIRVFKY